MNGNEKPYKKSRFYRKNQRPTGYDKDADENSIKTNVKENEQATEKVTNVDDIEDPIPLIQLMKEDTLIQSLEKLTQQLKDNKNDFVAESKAKTDEIETENVIRNKTLMKDLIYINDIDSNNPPAPFSYHDNRRTHTQLVYMNRDNRMRDDPTFELGMQASFDSVSIRNNFVSKVYSILSIQLLLTFAFVLTAVYVNPIKYFILTNFVLYLISSILMLVLLMSMACFVPLRRKFPLNFFLLFLFSLCFSYTTATAACFYSEETVLYAVGGTAIITALITLIAYSNIFDITNCGFILCMAGVVMAVFGVIALIVYLITGSETMYLVYAFLCVLLFTVYLLYDTQQILGGGRVALSPEEYILGALTLYVDILMIFNYLLLILGRR
ncbi:protein lifeguard 3-like [Diorhabda carinulata]|uniref:protein lifeguard 3-like n=1 Tax=Diorhabda carinulata TaxID=1163345 RepID=UPI0025A2DCC6|nr:protein lifeguard 3-like [Diorhabda carinulata]